MVVNKTIKRIIDKDGNFNLYIIFTMPNIFKTLCISGQVTVDVLDSVLLQSSILHGVKCLYLSVSTNRHHINWALSIRNPHTETLVGLPGNQKLVKKITVGLASDKPYIVGFYLYGFKDHERPTSGEALIGEIILVDGPCPEGLFLF